MKAIEIENLTFSYDKGEKVFNNLSLNIEKGKYCVILGRNGSGKSTLAKLITGLLTMQEGQIKVDGIEINEKNIYDIRNRIGIVFQNPDNQFIGATVRDDIAFGLENHLVAQNKMDSIINEYAQKVGMDKYLDKEPSNLSGGQKQRVAIAGVLAMTPDIVIFDEATSMLDPKGKKEIKEVILKMRELFKDMTILSITHDVEEALLADEVIVVDNGNIAIQGHPEKVFIHYDLLKKLNLDIPFAYKFKNLLEENGIDIDTIDIEKMVKKLCQ
ncbi:MAG: energy-coupling factor transporter ATPase [Bacilli bacterium]|nr:energy-coupling factor transporter ATPase [Bacilli bacterium]